MRALLAALLLIALAGPARAQPEVPREERSDVQLWLSTGIQFKPFRKKPGNVAQQRFFRNLRGTADLGWRLDENVSRLKQMNVDAGLKYPLLPFMRVGAEYRFSKRDRYTNDRHRIDLQLWLKQKKGRFTADYRFEYERTFLDPRKERTLLRNRLGLGYNFPKWKFDPYASAESFTALHYKGNRLAGMRYELGTAMYLDKKKRNELEVAIRYDQDIGRRTTRGAWVLALALKKNLKRK